MNTQTKKNSIYIASANYRMKRKERELKTRLAAFFVFLGGICALLYSVISSLPY